MLNMGNTTVQVAPKPAYMNCAGAPDFSKRPRRQPQIVAGEEKQIIWPDDEITICGTGPSKVLAPPSKREDPANGVQMWGVNRLFRFRQCDVGFAFDQMDGPTGMLVRDADRGSDLLKEIAEAGMPFYYSTPLQTKKPPANLIPYPIGFVLRELGNVYFTSSIAYIIAYAIACDVRKINIAGIDMWCGNNYPEYNFEKPCLDYWTGFAMGKGIQINIPWITSLSDRQSQLHNLYGFNPQDERFDIWIPKDVQLVMRADDNQVKNVPSEVLSLALDYFRRNIPDPAQTKRPDQFQFARARVERELNRRLAT